MENEVAPISFLSTESNFINNTIFPITNQPINQLLKHFLDYRKKPDF